MFSQFYAKNHPRNPNNNSYFRIFKAKSIKNIYLTTTDYTSFIIPPFTNTNNLVWFYFHYIYYPINLYYFNNNFFTLPIRKNKNSKILITSLFFHVLSNLVLIFLHLYLYALNLCCSSQHLFSL